MVKIYSGLIGLTLVYAALVVALEFKTPMDCLGETKHTFASLDTNQQQYTWSYEVNTVHCQTDGVDNTILNWSSDFFVSLCLFLFAFQLSLCPKTTTTIENDVDSHHDADDDNDDNDDGVKAKTKKNRNTKGVTIVTRKDARTKNGTKNYKLVTTTNRNEMVRNSGILVQVFMGGAFLMHGIGSLLFPMNGLHTINTNTKRNIDTTMSEDEDAVVLGYWICYSIATLFFTISALCTAYFALEAIHGVVFSSTTSLSPKLCGGDPQRGADAIAAVMTCALIVVLSCVGVVTGSSWCAAAAATTALSAVEGDDLEDHVCYTIVLYSDLALNIAYALLWIPMSIVFRAASQSKLKSILGLSTPTASIIPPVVQWTIGSMLPVILFVVTIIFQQFDESVSYFDLWNTIYGTVLYHWSMLVTLYCVHNLSYGLTVWCAFDDTDRNDDVMTEYINNTNNQKKKQLQGEEETHTHPELLTQDSSQQSKMNRSIMFATDNFDAEEDDDDNNVHDVTMDMSDDETYLTTSYDHNSDEEKHTHHQESFNQESLRSDNYDAESDADGNNVNDITLDIMSDDETFLTVSTDHNKKEEETHTQHQEELKQEYTTENYEEENDADGNNGNDITMDMMSDDETYLTVDDDDDKNNCIVDDNNSIAATETKPTSVAAIIASMGLQ